MDILVVNCNTSVSMTEAIAATAVAAAQSSTRIVGCTPTWGVASADGYYDSFISAAAVLELLTTYPEHFDGVVMAGYGEHGREGARQLLDVPVVDITEASAIFAMLLGNTFGIVTSSDVALHQIEQSLNTAGLLQRCTGIRSVGLPVLELETSVGNTSARFLTTAHELIQAGAEVIILGCAGLTGLHAQLRDELPVPVVDGVAAAVALCESLVNQRLQTSKVGAFAPPNLTKSRPGWARSQNTPVRVLPLIGPEGTRSANNGDGSHLPAPDGLNRSSSEARQV